MRLKLSYILPLLIQWINKTINTSNSSKFRFFQNNPICKIRLNLIIIMLNLIIMNLSIKVNQKVLMCQMEKNRNL